MLLTGKNITLAGDSLQPVSPEILYHNIIDPGSGHAVFIKRLQALRLIDKNQYRKLKTELPYFVCAVFQPKFRKKENFIFTERFVLDIDHLSSFDLDLDSLRMRLKQDARAEMVFMSPGGDGLKVMFRLSRRISDSGYYALFYKSFCRRFAVEFDLRGAIDNKTHDVTRCCFISHDVEAWYNKDAVAVDPEVFMPDEGSVELDFLKAELRKTEKEDELIRKSAGAELSKPDALPDTVLARIKEKVGVKVRPVKEKYYEQPEQLSGLMDEINEQIDELGGRIISSAPISYGRQLRIEADGSWAEINIFYGKRGVSVVGTTKSGSNRELCEALVGLLKMYFRI